MNGPDSISDPVARRISYIGPCPSARSLAPTRIGSRLMTCRWVPLCLPVIWLVADMACQLCMLTSHYIRLMSSLACLLCMLTSQLHHDDIIIIRVNHMGRVSPSGRRRRVGRVYARGLPPRCRVTARAAVFDVRFRRGFQQWLRLFLLYTVVWSKHNFDNFHFWAKIKHYFKPCALIPIVGDSDSPMRGPVVYW